VIARQSLPKTQRTLHKVRAATREVDDDLSGVESLISSRDVSLPRPTCSPKAHEFVTPS
jgi:hypothetical protein